MSAPEVCLGAEFRPAWHGACEIKVDCPSQFATFPQAKRFWSQALWWACGASQWLLLGNRSYRNRCRNIIGLQAGSCRTMHCAWIDFSPPVAGRRGRSWARLQPGILYWLVW